MTQIEIEEFASVDDTGIIYRGVDRSTGEPIAIRRFFPSEGAGLNEAQKERFLNLVEKLSKLKHPALRAIISGGVDPVDKIPYVVTQWMEGDTLSVVIKRENIEIPRAIDMIRSALELSIVVSKLIEKDAVWIDTNPDSIIVSHDDNARKFTFTLCPFKLLGMSGKGADLKPIISLADALCGWKSKFFGNQATYGFYYWVKNLKANPKIPLQTALNSLSKSIEQAPSKTEEESTEDNLNPVPDAEETSKSWKFLLLGFMAVLLVLAVIFAPKLQALLNTQGAQIVEVAASTPATNETELRFYSPDDTKVLEQMETYTRVRIRGQLAGIEFSNSQERLFLLFSEPYLNGQIRGVVHQRDFQDDYALATFEPLIGSTIELEGYYMRDSSENPLLVKIVAFADITKTD